MQGWDLGALAAVTTYSTATRWLWSFVGIPPSDHQSLAANYLWLPLSKTESQQLRGNYCHRQSHQTPTTWREEENQLGPATHLPRADPSRSNDSNPQQVIGRTVCTNFVCALTPCARPKAQLLKKIHSFFCFFYFFYFIFSLFLFFFLFIFENSLVRNYPSRLTIGLLIKQVNSWGFYVQFGST